MQGEPLKGYKHWFDPALREAGISFFTWYCLRHTFGSRLVMAGVDLRAVAELIGHKTIQMTMRYAHLAPAHTLAAVERLAGGGRWINQLTPKLTPAVSSKNPGHIESQLTLGVSARLKQMWARSSVGRAMPF
jgi:hypothetical protein